MASIQFIKANPLHHINNIQRIHTLIHLGKAYPKSVLESLKIRTPALNTNYLKGFHQLLQNL